jgi:hypothetical protein
MKRILCTVLTGAALALSCLPATAQDRAPAQSTPPVTEGSEEIVVAGLRDLDDPHSAVTRRTLGSQAIGVGARESRRVFYYSQRFAKCAMKRSPSNLRLLRRVLDVRTNSSAQGLAQSLLLRAHVSCTEDPHLLLQTGGNAARSNYYDTAYYDRGALFIEALKTYAPKLVLTKAQTGDPAVQARFDAREVSLAKFRLPTDRRYFETAICLVRQQPELAVRLVRTDSPDDETINRLEAAMVNRARECVSGAKRVYFDPVQFRFYVADVVYRWAVAARGVESLIPEE